MKAKVHLLATSKGMVSFDGDGNMFFTRCYSEAEPYFNDLQVDTAAKNLGLSQYGVLILERTVQPKKCR